MGGSIYLPTNCTAKRCKFFPYRLGKNPNVKPGITPLRSIRLYCLDCVRNTDEVKNCSMPECPVYYYRFGKNPLRKGISGSGNTKSLENYRKNRAQYAIKPVESTISPKSISNH